MLLALCIVTTAVYVDDSEPEPIEAEPLGVAFSIALAVLGITYVCGISTGYFAGKNAADQYWQQKVAEMKEQQGIYETEVVRLVLDGETNVLVTAYDSQANIWGFTNAHWQRQAEVAAAALWESGKSINYTEVLQTATLYHNLSILSEDLMLSPDYIYSFLQNRLDEWKSSGDNTMSITFNVGASSNLSSAESMDVSIRTMTDIYSNSEYNKVYLYAGDLWTFGGQATITSADGKSIVLQEGKTDLSKVSGFEEGLYTLQDSRQYAGCILPAAVSGAADLTSCAILHCGTENTLAYYDPDQSGLVVGGYQRSKLTIDTSSGSSTTSVDVMPILEKHDTMINALERTVMLSRTAAGGAWSIFTNANAASALISPSSMITSGALESISEEQLAIIGTVALRQLSEYYTNNGTYLEEAQYTFSSESLGVYVRGNIYSAEDPDTPLYENIIFSPFVWTKELNLVAGSKTAVSQSGVIAVWDQWDADSTQSIKSWNSSVTAGNCTLLDMHSGYTIQTYEILTDSKLVSSYTLSVQKITEWEGGGEQGGDGPPFLPDSDNYAKYATLIALIFAAIGAWVAYSGYKDDDYLIVIIGIAVIIIGYLARHRILDWIAGLL